jgi:hypothetical protein
MIILTPQDKKILYSRYHALRAQARDKELPFYWQEVAHFYEDVALHAPEDYNPETHTIRFDRRVVETDGYCPQAMRFKRFSKDVTSRRKQRKIEKLQLSFGDEASILALATGYLCLSILEEKGDIDELVENAFLYASRGE